jgi:hypothetical protein
MWVTESENELEPKSTQHGYVFFGMNRVGLPGLRCRNHGDKRSITQPPSVRR